MLTLVIAVEGAAGAAAMLLCFLAWKHRAVLAGVCSSAAVLLAAAAISARPGTRTAWTLLIFEVVVLVIALAVFSLPPVGLAAAR